MIKFYFPQDITNLKPYVPADLLRKDLLMVAEEDGLVKAVCCFYYQNTAADIHAVIPCHESTGLLILDGLIRSALFHMAELDCIRATVEKVPAVLSDHLIRLGFEPQGDGLCCDDFPKVLFSG